MTDSTEDALRMLQRQLAELDAEPSFARPEYRKWVETNIREMEDAWRDYINQAADLLEQCQRERPPMTEQSDDSACGGRDA